MHYPDGVSDVIDPRGDLQWGTIPNLVEDAAARFGEAEAVVDPNGPHGTTTRLTFDQLAEEVATTTRAVLANGIERGDRVAIWAPNCAEWIVAALGAVGAGALLVPLNTRFKGAEAAYIIKSSGARILFTVQGFLGNDYPALLDAAAAEGHTMPDLERIVVLRGGDEDAPPPKKGDRLVQWAPFLAEGESVPEDLAAGRTASITSGDMSDLVFTSGTTGYPKGAMTTHSQTLRTFAAWSAVVGLRSSDRYLIVNPFFHTFGYKAGILACLMTGATMVPEAVFDVDRVVNRIAAEKITVLPGPPTIYQSILDRPDRARFDLSSLRLVVTGAATIPVELVERMWSDLGITTVLTAYGLTEATGTVTMCRRGDPAEIIAGTSGRAIPDVEVRVVGPDSTEELPRGEAGEIIVRGYNVMLGYWDNPDATDEVIDPDGWLHTGDIGTMDADGNIAITDRLKDMFVSGGFNAYPAEIEAVLVQHPGVAQVAVIGVPDERLGEVGLAYVVVAPGADPDAVVAELPDWARERLANYKAPRTFVPIDALPLNAGGKVLKRELRDLRRSQLAAGAG